MMKRHFVSLALAAAFAISLAVPNSAQALDKLWNANGVSSDNSSGWNLNTGGNWSGSGQVPGSNDNAFIIFSRSQQNSNDATLTNSASNVFSTQGLTISNVTDRISNTAHNDTITFSGAVALTSNLFVTATGGANNYSLNVAFNNTTAARNVTFNGARLGATAGQTMTATLTFGGPLSVTSNLTFNGNTGRNTLNLNGATTIGRDLTFNAGAGTNILRIAGATTVSNNVTFLNPSAFASNLVFVSNHLNVLGSFSNSGRVVLQDGQITANTLSNTGHLSGNGTLTGNFSNNGTLAPGLSVGKLTVTGDLNLGNTSVIEIELANASSFDEIIIGGQMTFGGTLNVLNATGFELQLGDTFKIFTFTSAQGSFDSVNLPALGNSLVWNTSLLLSDGVISVVPEPGTVKLVLAGLCAMWCATRLRRPRK